MRRRKRRLSNIAVRLTGLLLITAVSCSSQPKSSDVAADAGGAGQSSAWSAKSDYYAKPASTFLANPFCRACHLDFDEEKLARTHERAGIGCERCHGESLRHRSDEANVTPPELMWPKERINPMCMMCHPRHEIRHIKDHRPILEAGLSIFDELPSDENARNYCTDCHGCKHRMQTRSIRWNKATGEPLR